MNNNKKVIIILGVVFLLIISIGLTYAIYARYSEGTINNKLIVGDIYMRYNNSQEISLSNVTPRDSYIEGEYYEFQIIGKNTSSKDIWYDIKLEHGANHQTKTTRLQDKFLKFRLVEVVNNQEVEIFDDISFNNINNTRVYVDTILKNTSTEITKTFRLYCWINGVLIGNLQEADYDSNTWNNQVYASIKVNISGDFSEKSLVQTITDGCWTLSANTMTQKATITGYSSSCSNDVVIPSIIGGYQITAIGNGAFIEKDLTSVTIPNSVVTIGTCAFADNQLTSLTLGSGVETIGDNAFSTCHYNNRNKLTSVTIPDSVTYIGNDAFANNKLTSVTLGNNVEYIGNNAFSMDSSFSLDNFYDDELGRNLTLLDGNQITSITIPNSVTYLGEYAFAYNALTTVVIGNGLTMINYSTFEENLITNITFGNNVEYINSCAFLKNRLTSLTIPDSVTLIDDNAFNYNSLTSLTLGNNVIDILDSAFYDDEDDGTNPYTSYSGRAYGPNALSTVTIPSSINEPCSLQNAFPSSVTLIYNGVSYTPESICN